MWNGAAFEDRQYKCVADINNGAVYNRIDEPGANPSEQSVVKLHDDVRVKVHNSGCASLGMIETEHDGVVPVERGVMCAPIWSALANDGTEVATINSDVSDRAIAEAFGAIFAPTISTSPEAAMEHLGHFY